MEAKLRLREKIAWKLLRRHVIDHTWTPCEDGSHMGCLAIEVEDKWYDIVSKIAGMDAQKLLLKWGQTKTKKG